jgi:hypothetical protein
MKDIQIKGNGINKQNLNYHLGWKKMMDTTINLHTCSVCSTDFDEYSEGGTVGEFGILPVAFCPTCLACMCDMADQMRDPAEELD